LNKKATIYEVAKKAKVSLATVSRVLNNNKNVSIKTATKVKKAIKELNYIPNALARNLATNKGYQIALIVPEVSFSFISRVISGVVDVGLKNNYNVVLYSTNYGKDSVNKIINSIIESRIDGVIIINSEINTQAMAKLSKNDIPLTIIGTPVKGKIRSSVSVNYEKITYEVIRKYLQNNYYKIIFIDGEYNRFVATQILSGIKQAFLEDNTYFDGYLQVDESYSQSYLQIYDYLKHNKVDLIIGARDSLAIAALNAALDLNIVIAEDLDIIGYNNTKYSRMARPALSTIEVPKYDLGAKAAMQMVKMLRKEEIVVQNEVLDTYFVRRNSSKIEV
jgi:LacI family transcriptional regulator